MFISSMTLTFVRFLAACAALLFNAACDHRMATAPASAPRTIRVSQTSPADVVGSDNAALQKAADLLKPGDTLLIGEGTFTMDNSLFVPSGVTARGVPGKTILKKSAGVRSALAEDGDYGESAIAVAEPARFRPGMGITILDDPQSRGWDVSVTAVTGVQGPYILIRPPTVRDYDFEQKNARVTNTFPILCVINAEYVLLEGITVDGNRQQNDYLDGCRGGAIYLNTVRNVTVRNCVARNYNGDGISFQITDGVKVIDSESHGHAGFGAHPGTGSANALIKGCNLHDNDDIGLFLCWRVRHGRFEDNRMERNGHHGISIGHKDTGNLFVNNTITNNGVSGVWFREESVKNSGHRNTFRNNRVLDNGGAKGGFGFFIASKVDGTVIENNRIADTRTTARTQRVAIQQAPGAGSVKASGNESSQD
jgi:parallel beta-helix repeat protein